MKRYILGLHSEEGSSSLIPIHLYLSLFAVAGIELVWIYFGRVTFVTGDLTPTFAIQISIGAFLYLVTKQMDTDSTNPVWRFLRFMLEAGLILKLGWIIMRLFNHLTMTTAMPLQDGVLSLWDSYLGVS